MERAVQEKGLERFYPHGSPALDRIAHQAPAKVEEICQKWRLPKEVGRDVARLGLYDIILYIGQDSFNTVADDGLTLLC